MVASGTPRLPIRDILNANPAWIRGSDEQLGDLSELKSSIQELGVKVPVLLEPDYRVLDGARRLLAASDLGHEVVPVVIINDWDQAYKQFAATRHAEREGLPHEPMDLFALEQLIAALKVIYEPRMREISVVHAKESRRTGIKLKREGGSRVSMFDQNLTDMLDIEATPLKAVRSVMASMRDCYKVSKELGEEAEAYVRDYVANGGMIWVLRALLVDLKRGVRTSQQPRRLRHDSAPIETRKVPIQPDDRKAKEQVDAASEVVRVLEDMGRIVHQMEEFNPAADTEVLAALQDRRRAALSRINRLRNLLEIANKAQESENGS